MKSSALLFPETKEDVPRFREWDGRGSDCPASAANTNRVLATPEKKCEPGHPPLSPMVDGEDGGGMALYVVIASLPHSLQPRLAALVFGPESDCCRGREPREDAGIRKNDYGIRTDITYVGVSHRSVTEQSKSFAR